MKLPRLRTRSQRRLAAIAAALLLAIAVLLAVMPLPEPIAPVGDTFDNLVRSLITASVLGALAYLWFYFWVSDKATQKLIEAARREPERLFPHPREVGTTTRVIGRESLVEELQTNLTPDFNTGPQIVVGDTGAGKTSLLLALAAKLAEEEVLPIVLSLRESGNGSGPLSFRDLARNRFGELVDPYVKTEADADKLWRWMCSHDQVAVLADDLDRCAAASSDGYKAEIRVALDAARRRKLPLVVTTRPSGLPPDLPDPPIDLAQKPLVMEADGTVVSRILSEAGTRDPAHRKLVEDTVEAGNLLENAFYVDLVARLLRADALSPPTGPGKHTVRIGLLDSWREVLCGGRHIGREEHERRDDCLRQVEELALGWLDPEVKREVGPELSAVRAGERLDLLYLDDRAVPRFTNEVLHAYFASRAIEVSDPAWLTTLGEASDSARVQLAMVFAAAAGKGDRFCELACEKLLANGEDDNSDQSLLRAAAAAEIARAGGFRELDRKIAKRCIAARPDAGPVAKRAALEQVTLLGGNAAIDALWEFGHDADYDTRWGAVQKLTQRCTETETEDGQRHRDPVGLEAYRRLQPKVQGALDTAARLDPGEGELDDWDPRLVPLKQAGWMLPPLACRARQPELRRTVRRQLSELIELEKAEVTKQRGLEASIAQGFKAAALLSPEAPPSDEARELLKRARFWYSQLNLVHGIALQMSASPDYGRKDLEALVDEAGESPSQELHPLLRYATELCGKVLDDPPSDGGRLRKMTRVVWDDEGAVASGRPVDLTPEAMQLVGEITVLLDLNETGDARKREEFGTNNRLPYCLRDSEDRAEFRRGCHSSCTFHLCPFHPVRDRPSAHRELSTTFCRDQARNARAGVAGRWGSKVKKQGLGEFWKGLEKQARF